MKQARESRNFYNHASNSKFYAEEACYPHYHDYCRQGYCIQPKNHSQNCVNCYSNSVNYSDSKTTTTTNYPRSTMTPSSHHNLFSYDKAYPKLSKKQYFEIVELENQIKLIKEPKKPSTAYQIFENKEFNLVKKQMPHLQSKEISDFLYQQWKFQLDNSDKEIYFEMAKQQSQEYFQQLKQTIFEKNLLRQKIYDIKYNCIDKVVASRSIPHTLQNQSASSNGSQGAVKPSGKLKFMSAYRFFRRELVPIMKSTHPEMDGKDRQKMIKDHWRELNDNQKYAYVQMSRADREKALYIHKLCRIKNDLMKNNPELVEQRDIVGRIDQRIKEELEDVSEDSSEFEQSFDDNEETDYKAVGKVKTEGKE
ncbi:UNKNOWN [Stylonychia lemnae]|uniref:HMG box domain-containing protein n=1 Tax=Stylonychia lemnae TaxID=5949 RepID=A0A078AQ62_STYLE|nr:UNKNOWN [Stylonychia lemnae]|eukprot:CDW84111.1 UNKNOWN [Stylonychia lemnae]